MRTLHQCLQDTDVVRLNVIARLWDVTLSATRRRDVAAELAQAMAAPEKVTAAWELLSADQQAVLGRLVSAGGKMPRRVFTRDWGQIRAMGPGRMEREEPWKAPVSPAEALWYSGFVHRAFDQGPEGAYEVIFVPAELRTHLPAPSDARSAISLEPASDPPVMRRFDETFLDDGCGLLSYLQNERVRLGAGGTWPARHQAGLQRHLRHPDPDRLALLLHLARRLGWLKEGRGRTVPDPQAAISWLQSPAEEQRDVLAQAWRSDPAWNDLFHVPSLRPVDTGAWRNEPLLAREAVLHHLVTCGPDTWYAIGDLVSAIKRVDPDFQRPDGDYDTWYIRDATTEVYLAGFENWESVEGALIRYLITRPLAWLGLVDLGAERPDGPAIAFRLTQAGARFLDGGPGEAAPGPGHELPPLVLRDDFTVQVPAGRRYDRFQLSRIADWVGSGDPYVYRLTPRSLARGQRQSIPVERVIPFLERVTGAEVPEPVARALLRWDEQGPEARLERAVLLRLSSQSLAEQVMGSPGMRRLLGERVGSTAILVPERHWPRLIVALGRMGVVPDVAGLEGEDDAG